MFITPDTGQSRFLSTPSARRATYLVHLSAENSDISIHALREEGDRRQTGGRYYLCHISIHALREEGDAPSNMEMLLANKFLSTPSARRATSLHRRQRLHRRNFYPRPPRGGRLEQYNALVHRLDISIHALREEGDAVPLGRVHACRISIHALREEGDWLPTWP